MKALEAPVERQVKVGRATKSKQAENESEWQKFIRETYGCLLDSPIKRGDQGVYEVRGVID